MLSCFVSQKFPSISVTFYIFSSTQPALVCCRLHSLWLYLLSCVGAGADANAPTKPWVGEVIKIESGRIHVCWSDKSVSVVWPNEVVLVDEDNHEEYDEEDDEDYEEVESDGEEVRK